MKSSKTNTKSPKIRVFLVDDDKSVRDSLRMFLNFSGEFDVIGEASNGKEALEKIPQLDVDIAMVDITMPVLDGFETIQQLRPLKPDLRILVFTADPSAEKQSMKVGADGFLSKVEIPQLIESLKLLHRGKVHYDAQVLASLLQTAPRIPASSSQLSIREREVLALISDGLNSREIADRLGLSNRTVETHRSRIMNSLNIHGVVGLTKFAIRAGLTEI